MGDGGELFKVVKETIMTPTFELDSAADKEVSKKVKDPTRKLKDGELLEVREWPKLEEKSGLTRMKCKAMTDGSVGWVTTIGNAGTVFVVARSAPPPQRASCSQPCLPSTGSIHSSLPHPPSC